MVLGFECPSVRGCVLKLPFIEKKVPNMSRIAELFDASINENTWANRGPVYRQMAEIFSQYIGVPSDRALVPVANGGVALEAMARLHAMELGRKLKWVASAYSFRNLGRGYFSDVTFVDCDANGRLDLGALRKLHPDDFDGVIVTNPFGLTVDFDDFKLFADTRGKALLLDNASGMHTQVPNLPWQAISLHHTKPYGMGEGGFVLVPSQHAGDLYDLIDYKAELRDDMRQHWFQNGKLSDISAAFLIDRLEQFSNWGPKALEQRERVIEIAESLGLKPLITPATNIPMTSMPFLAEVSIPLAATEITSHMTFKKYYHPLRLLPNVLDIYDRLINVPCHGDVAFLSNAEIASDMEQCLSATAVSDLRQSWKRRRRIATTGHSEFAVPTSGGSLTALNKSGTRPAP